MVYLNSQEPFEKINLVRLCVPLFFNIPHLAYDTIIYQIAMSLKIPITIVTQSLFPDKFFSLEKIECYGDFNKEGLRAYPPIKLRNKHPQYMAFNMNY